MSLLLQILGFASLAHLMTDFLSEYEYLPNKPFKCNLCTGFWLSIGPFIALHGWEGPLLAGIAGVTSELIYRIIERI